MDLPQLPAPTKDFIQYVATHSETPLKDLIKPYNEREARLRELYAQSRDARVIQDPYVNAIPLYAGHESSLKIRARGIEDEHENSKYIVPLKNRKPNGSPALVESFNAFKKNFTLFSESSLADLNWDNVIVGGSAVVNCLLPVSQEHMESTRALRTYYHDELAPSSDVDLFLWGLSEEEAVEKIKEIEKSIKDSILAETTTIRTKNAITIASQYPTRHIQIVLRLYKSVSEILTGFDVDSSCFAYDGRQVYGTPRGIAAFLTQCNTVDLSRRSPSYENRLFKYANRGFEIYCADLERNRIDPTIYERAFARVQGLARLLVLERLPKESDRDNYRDQRRRERARPALNPSWQRNRGKLRDNFKDKDPQDVAEWVMEEQDDVSNYHTFTVPYGPRYNAKKIEKLLYTKDLLLNAEWNSKKERSVNLHRHPCFVGDAEYIVTDCCTACPKPVTPEEMEIAAEENKKYVSGDISFVKDDPGRQTIGSFHPLTSEDWTDQAYLGNTESLCHAIVGGDLDYVQEWCTAHHAKLDRRDHTGRTPLQLACQVSAVDMVKTLVDAGARMVARLTDGLTALHIACINGNADIVKILLERSEANEELEAEKEDRKRANASPSQSSQKETPKIEDREQEDEEDDNASDTDGNEEEYDDVGDEASDADAMSTTQGSYIKVKSIAGNEEATMEEEAEAPDVFDVNVLAWDAPVSPLHLAIICGHIEVIRLLVDKFGADVLLPVKLLSEYDNSPYGAILTLVLAARNTERSSELTKTLLELGASPSQSDMHQFSALHSVALLGNIEAIKIMIEKDAPKAKVALNHISVDMHSWQNNTKTPLLSVLANKNEFVALQLLEAGADTTVSFNDWAKAYVASATAGKYPKPHDKATLEEKFTEFDQPIIVAANHDCPAAVEALLDAGVDVNTIDSNGSKLLKNSSRLYVHGEGQTLLDVVTGKAKTALPTNNSIEAPEPPTLLSQHEYLHGLKNGSYEHWQIQNQYVLADEVLKDWESLKEAHNKSSSRGYNQYSEDAIHKARELRDQYRQLKQRILDRGAKAFKDLHPDVKRNNHGRYVYDQPSESPHSHKTETKLIKLSLDFEVPSVHEENKGRYKLLFEACWSGDKEKIKQLTTKPDANGNVLRIAVKDNMGLTPLHIAIWRGEYDIADLILEIAHLQCVPRDETETKKRYFIRDRDEDSEMYHSGNEEDSSEEFYVSSELVDEEFTIDDVAKLAQQAGSKTTAQEYLSWAGQFWMFASLPGSHSAFALGKSSSSSNIVWLQNYHNDKTSISFFQDHFADHKSKSSVDLLAFAIDIGDLDLVRKTISWNEKYQQYDHASKTRRRAQGIQSSSTRYLFRALKNGHTNIASELVLSSGCGMPIESLAEKAGLERSDAPKYYQGLLLRGKHKQEWAKEANKTADTTSTDNSLKTSLFLQAIRSGNIAAVEWCMSDSPARLLKQWLLKTEDERLQKLAKASGGFDKFVDDWLGSRRELAIHEAVMTYKWQSQTPGEKEDAAEVLKYLIRIVPESLETKSATGHTPLALAFWLRMVDPATILISTGVNQATRDYRGCNIIHLLLNQSRAWTKAEIATLNELLGLLDSTLSKTLFTERCSLGPTGMTPLATWLWRQQPQMGNARQDDDNVIEMMETLLKYADREPLNMVDGGGQMPLHSCVKQTFNDLIEFLCQTYPELVLVENGMGQTALELCTSIYVGEATSRDSTANHRSNRRHLSRQDQLSEDQLMHGKALNILRKAQSEVSEKKRVLISSLQASEVAKRLADAKQRQQAPIHYRRSRYGLVKDEKYRDEVEKYLKDHNYINDHSDQQS